MISKPVTCLLAIYLLPLAVSQCHPSQIYHLTYTINNTRKQMNSKTDKKNPRAFKLPHIPNNKTATTFLTDPIDSTSSRIRPNSSNKVGELQKNLFLQLEQYDDIGKKPQRKIKAKKDLEGLRSINAETSVSIDAPYLKKLEKLMPQTFQKVHDSRIANTLQTSHSLTLSKSSQTHTAKNDVSGYPAHEAKRHQRQHSQASQIKNSRISTSKSKDLASSQVKKQRQSSFTLAERELEAIYQKYLEEQGLTQLNNISCGDLQQLNEQLREADEAINQMERQLSGLISQFDDYVQIDDQ